MKILLPTSFSKSSGAAADFALSFFGYRASYILLNSYPFIYRSGFYDSFNNYKPELDEIPLEKLKREKKRLTNKYGTQVIVEKALYGDPVKDIFRTAEEEKVDLIILGYENFKKWNDGFNYRKHYSLEDLPFPILLVPENYQHDENKSLFYITDFSNSAISQSMNLVRSIAKFTKASVKLYCFEYNDEDNGIEKWTLDKHLNDVEHAFEIVQTVNGGLQKLIQELKEKKDNSLVIFDFKQNNNPIFKTIEKQMRNRSFVKPLLLMPNGYEDHVLRGA